MGDLEDRADAMLESPLGCGFLLAAAASGLSPAEITAPQNSLYLCAYASRDIEVWQGDYQRIRTEILRHGQKHRDLAISILEQPAANAWFGPLDKSQQVCVPREKQTPDAASFVAPAATLSGWERYAEKILDGTFTSTLVDGAGGVASIHVGIDEKVADIGLGFQPAPYAAWKLVVEPGATVLEIDGPRAWHDLCARYPACGSSERQTPDFSGDEGRIVPDWGAIAHDWDGVHLTFGGLLAAEQVRVQSPAGWTYHWSWNVEQTLWLRWVFTSVERLLDHTPQKSPLEGLFHPMFRARSKL